ncbi:MAG: hypothetical protein Q9224_006409, partial [Gallowayella concinna]
MSLLHAAEVGDIQDGGEGGFEVLNEAGFYSESLQNKCRHEPEESAGMQSPITLHDINLIHECISKKLELELEHCKGKHIGPAGATQEPRGQGTSDGWMKAPMSDN